MAAEAIRRKAAGSEARPDPPRANPTARMLAPFALVVATLIVGIVIAGSVDGDGDGRGKRRAARVEPGPKQATYTVQPGDTVVGIGSEYDVPVATILQCNRDLDPQNLASGLKIKLRC